MVKLILIRRTLITRNSLKILETAGQTEITPVFQWDKNIRAFRERFVYVDKIVLIKFRTSFTASGIVIENEEELRLATGHQNDHLKWR